MHPRFLIIGAQKSGTTALADTLGRHPDVFISEPREPEYFSRQARGEAGALSWEDYQELFAGAGEGQVSGEASTGTMLSPEVIPEIDKRLPEVRLIAILREPAGRAYSGFTHHTKKGLIGVKEGPAIFREEAERFLRGEECHHDWFARSEYGRQLGPFVRHFAERLKVVIFEELVARPEAVLREVQEFLSLPPRELHLTRENTTRVPRGRVSEAIVACGRRIVGPVRRSLSEKGYRRFREGIMRRLGRRIGGLDPVLASRLREDGFRRDREELERILGRPIEAWITNENR
jgi:hypothetical protein